MSERCEKCNQPVRGDRHAFGVWTVRRRAASAYGREIVGEQWHLRLAPGLAVNIGSGIADGTGKFWVVFGNGWKTSIETDSLDAAKRFALEVAINLSTEALHRARTLKEKP